MSLLTSLLHQLEPDILPYVIFQLILQVSHQSQTKHACTPEQALHLTIRENSWMAKACQGKTIHGLKHTTEGEYEKQNLFLVFYFS